MVEKKSNEIKPKFYFDVCVDTMLPATLKYRILAETPEQAIELMKGKAPSSVHYKLVGKKDFLLKVFYSGSNMMKFIKRLLS